MIRGKRIGWKRPKHPLLTIISAPFAALIFSVPAVIIATISFFIFGLIGWYVDPIGEATDAFFNMLPFWNDKWDYAWTLYFGIIVGIIVEMIATAKWIYKSFSEYEHVPTKAEREAAEAEYYQWKWENMSLEEKKDELRKTYPDTYNEIYYGIPKPQNNAEILAELKKQQEQRDRDAFMRHLENKRKYDEIKDEIKKLK